MNHQIARLIAGCAFAFLSATVAFAQIPAFPGALGFGANATGGRSGTVYHVTTLADSGPGSFRDAVSAANRIVVFDVGGYVSLSSAVSVNKNITIAGQTAPGGGIGFKGGKISFGSRSNIVCRYIRIRPGSDTASTDDVGLNLYNARNIICDHVSIEFAPWNNIGAVSDDWQNFPVTDVTFQNCLDANPTGQHFGAHTESVSSTMSWFYTLFANSNSRNPMSKINDVFVNNVLYNCHMGYTTHTSTDFSHDIVNNYFIAGPIYGGSTMFPWYQMDANQSIYYSGNLFDGDQDGALGGGITTPYWYNGVGTILSAPWSSLTTNIPIYSPTAAYRITVSQAGALPRDQVDSLVISQVKTLGYGTAGTGAGTTGEVYDSQTDTGLGNNGYGVINGGIPAIDSDLDGMPDYWEKTVGLSPTSNDAMTIAADGYANIEHYLNWLADPHALTVTNTAVDVDLWQYTSGFTNASPTYSVFNASNGVVTLTNSHIAHFTPDTNYFGLGTFQFGVVASDGSGYTNTVTIAIVPQSLAQTQPTYLTWRGDGMTNLWAVGDGTNWWNGTNLVAFNTGDNVTFDDTGTNTPAINLSGVLYAGTVYVLAAQDYTFGGSGVLAGPTALFKTGSGQLNINTTNTFAGGMIINEGVVQVGDGVDFIGSISGPVTNHDTLVFNDPGPVTSSASIAGSGVLIKRGAGTLTLSGSQSYTNLTTIEAGTLVFSGTPPPGNILVNSVLYFKPPGALTYAGAISGSGRVTAGSSSITLTLSGANSFSGGITVTTGNLLLGNSRAAGTGPVTNTSSGLIYLGNGAVITNDYAITTSTTDLGMRCDSGTATWTGNVSVSGGASWRPGSAGSGTLIFTGTANQGTHNFIVPRGTVHFASNAVVTSTGTATALGRDTSGTRGLDLTIRDNATLTLGACSIGGGQAGSNVTVILQNNATLALPANSFDLHNITRSASVSTLRLNGGTLMVAGFTKTQSSYPNVINFNGGLLVASSNNMLSFLPAFFGYQTANVQAGGARIDAGNYKIGIAQGLIHDPALGGTADGGLTKLGLGALGLNGNNTYNGPTMILAGTLLCGPGAITNSSGIYIASGAELDFQVSGTLTLGPGRTLSGNGSVWGDFILGNGAILAPGTNNIGRLNFIQSLTLAAGATNLFEISKAPLTNDSVTVGTTLFCGGTLIVTKTDVAALMAGDSFKLFNAGSYGSGFTKVILPSLNSGLAWNTNALTTSGVIAVVPAPPVFGGITVIDGNVTLGGSGGMATSNFYVLSATNMALPLSNWTRLLTNQFDNNGNFILTNDLDPNAAQSFYLLQLP